MTVKTPTVLQGTVKPFIGQIKKGVASKLAALSQREQPRSLARSGVSDTFQFLWIVRFDIDVRLHPAAKAERMAAAMAMLSLVSAAAGSPNGSKPRGLSGYLEASTRASKRGTASLSVAHIAIAVVATRTP